MSRVKHFLSFFIFWYYMATNNDKKVDFLSKKLFIVMITPLAFFVTNMILMLIFPSLQNLVLVWLPILVGNVMFCMSVMNEKQKRDRIERYEKLRKQEEEENLRREKEREERIRQVNEYLDEQLRRQLREAYEREQAHRERFSRQHQQQQKKQEQKPKVDVNLQNAKKLLGLSDNYTAQDIKSAYRKLSKIHHPDMGGLEANFIKLTTAYEYITKVGG